MTDEYSGGTGVPLQVYIPPAICQHRDQSDVIISVMQLPPQSVITVVSRTIGCDNSYKATSVYKDHHVIENYGHERVPDTKCGLDHRFDSSRTSETCV